MLKNHLEFVNEQIIFQQKTIEKLRPFPNKQKFHMILLERFEGLRNYLTENSNNQRFGPDSPPKTLRLTLTPGDVEGLPEELLKELSISEDRTEFAILNVLEEAGGIATLDQLLIGVYKKTKEVLKRPAMTSRLYRMGQKELIWGLPGKKGLYSNHPVSEEEAAKLLGVEPSQN
jgi:hypothetical protein